MIDEPILRFMLGAIALFGMVLISGTSLIIADAKRVNDKAAISRSSAAFVAIVVAEIVIIVLLALA
jgi:hypothetical protein